MRIGYDMPWRSWIYTHRVPRSPDLFPRHSVLNQWDLLAPLGIGPCTPEHDPVEMRRRPSQRRPGRDDGLARLCHHSDHRLVVVHVSAGNAFRRWPEESFVTMILGAGPTRSPPAHCHHVRAIRRRRRTARQRGCPTTAFDPGIAAPPHRLEPRRASRAHCPCGGVHWGRQRPAALASTTGTPIVALLGPTLPERSRPWRDPRLGAEMVDAGPLPCRPCDQRRCIPGDFRCLTRITPDQVLAAVERVLR